MPAPLSPCHQHENRYLLSLWAWIPPVSCRSPLCRPSTAVTESFYFRIQLIFRYSAWLLLMVRSDPKEHSNLKESCDWIGQDCAMFIMENEEFEYFFNVFAFEARCQICHLCARFLGFFLSCFQTCLHLILTPHPFIRKTCWCHQSIDVSKEKHPKEIIQLKTLILTNCVKGKAEPGVG